MASRVVTVSLEGGGLVQVLVTCRVFKPRSGELSAESRAPSSSPDALRYSKLIKEHDFLTTKNHGALRKCILQAYEQA